MLCIERARRRETDGFYVIKVVLCIYKHLVLCSEDIIQIKAFMKQESDVITDFALRNEKVVNIAENDL